MKDSTIIKIGLIVCVILSIFLINNNYQNQKKYKELVKKIDVSPKMAGGKEVVKVINTDSLKLRQSYEAGFKQALDSWALLNLELIIKEERKTFGEMEEILYKRYNIKK